MILLRHARGGRANLWADWTHREPAVTAEAVPVVLVRTDVEVAGDAAVGRAERTRPVVTLADIVEHGTFAVAGGRQEDGARGPRLCASQAVGTRPRLRLRLRRRAALAGGPRLCADGDDRGEQRRQTHSCPSAA